jgi:hypothetical protein
MEELAHRFFCIRFSHLSEKFHVVEGYRNELHTFQVCMKIAHGQTILLKFGNVTDVIRFDNFRVFIS